MVIGWSLQAPVTGIAAWLMIILKRPFKIGDRVIISGIIGDVVDITLTHVILNQVGGTVGGEERSGRGVLIPNATLFQQIIYNYTFETKYILDEVPVLITYGSDLDEAERILLAAAQEVAQDIIADCGQEPFTRAEFTDSGVRVRLRYQTLATERQRISSEIVEVIFREFNKNERVEFCYPHMELLYRPKEDRKTGKPLGPTGPKAG
jgi:small-conductance mechanosensitive channel